MNSTITDARAYNSAQERFGATLMFNSEKGSTEGIAPAEKAGRFEINAKHSESIPE